MNDTRKICKNCVHYEPDGYVKQNGKCKRYPPTVVIDGMGVMTYWPEVDDEDYCGEFKRVNKYGPTTGV